MESKLIDMTTRDEYWMQQALAQAEQAKQAGEVPVGAVLVLDDELIAAAHNCPITTHDPSAHAEMVVLRLAAKKIENYRLINASLYVTLEPCTMCAGAMVHARIKRLIFGTTDLRAGAVTTKAQVLAEPYLNHKVEYTSGILATPCSKILSDFFRERR